MRGAASSAISQGIGVATGLQSSFNFAGVAAAGVGGGVGGEFGGAIGKAFGSSNIGRFAGGVAVNTASALANAATRSAIDGSSFGDNIVAAIPDVVGSAIGSSIGGALAPGRAANPAASANAQIAADPVAETGGGFGAGFLDFISDASNDILGGLAGAFNLFTDNLLGGQSARVRESVEQLQTQRSQGKIDEIIVTGVRNINFNNVFTSYFSEFSPSVGDLVVYDYDGIVGGAHQIDDIIRGQNLDKGSDFVDPAQRFLKQQVLRDVNHFTGKVTHRFPQGFRPNHFQITPDETGVFNANLIENGRLSLETTLLIAQGGTALTNVVGALGVGGSVSGVNSITAAVTRHTDDVVSAAISTGQITRAKAKQLKQDVILNNALSKLRLDPRAGHIEKISFKTIRQEKINGSTVNIINGRPAGPLPVLPRVRNSLPGINNLNLNGAPKNTLLFTGGLIGVKVLNDTGRAFIETRDVVNNPVPFPRVKPPKP